MLALLLAAVLSLATAGQPGWFGAPPRWYGVALGTAAISYRPQLGDPLTVQRTIEGERAARFWIAAGGSTYLTISERHGAVVGIEVAAARPLSGVLSAVEPDPSGVTLGSDIDEVLRRYPTHVRSRDRDGTEHLSVELGDAGRTRATYTFMNRRLVADRWFVPAGNDGPAPPGAIEYGEPAGDAFTTAILDIQASEHDGITWERLYLQQHPCDGGGAGWVKTGQGLQFDRGRAYDVISVTCPSTSAKRAFYFDITSFHGKS